MYSFLAGGFPSCRLAAFRFFFRGLLLFQGFLSGGIGLFVLLFAVFLLTFLGSSACLCCLFVFFFAFACFFFIFTVFIIFFFFAVFGSLFGG